jgi:DNA-binding SARP family transcriptional activator
MACYARTGRRAEAIRVYERFARLLRAELDAAPEAETTALHERVQRGAAS